MQIPFYRPSVTQSEIDEVVDTLRSGWLTTGPKTKLFEQEFAVYIAQKHAVALNSCTAALHLALEAIGLQAGDTVVVPTMTFAATAEVVRYFNATPLLVDCGEDDFNLDVADAERKIQSALTTGQSVAAIMPVHYGGQIGDVEGVRKLAQKYHLKIVEDAAHCCPAFYKPEVSSQRSKVRGQMTEDGGQPSEIGKAISRAEESGNTLATPHPALSPTEAERETGPEVSSQLSVVEGPPSTVSGHSSLVTRHLSPASAWLPVGTGADITCFSFYANKCITTGEGGMACTNSEEYAERMRIMSLHGISKDAWKRFTAEGSWYYEIVAPGFKYNLTDIAAAIGIHQLRRADELHQKRRNIAALYTRLLEEVEELILPRELPNRIHSWHLYAIRLKLDRLKLDRAQVIQQMKERGIGTSVHWMPLHMHPYYREKYRYKPEDFPVAASLYPQLITLPLYPDMTEAEVGYVCDTLKSSIARNLKSEVPKVRGGKAAIKALDPG